MTTKIPPLTARMGQACHSCFIERAEKNISRCSKCRSVAYCSSDCQKKDWPSHKAICKSLYAIENDSASRSILLSPSAAPSSNFKSLNSIILTRGMNFETLLKRLLNRPLNTVERNIVAFEPKCLACTRSDRIIRMENPGPDVCLGSCPMCQLAFFCSEEHWDVVSAKHMNEPCEGGYDGLSQCELNQNMLVDARFATIMGGSSATGLFQWAPERIKSQWIPLPEVKTWDGEYGDELRNMAGGRGPPLDPFLRGASEGLSFPLTIIYALQSLNDNDEWTSKETLTVHIMGASVDKEVMYAMLFEEVLHRLPKVKTLKLLLCGPDLKTLTGSKNVFDMETCPYCKRQERKRIHQHQAEMYHEYAQKLGTKFVKPDIAIAFNSGSSEIESWANTIKFLVDEKIPSAFTSYNRDEAEAEASIIRRAGANLVSSLGPKENPWGSKIVRPEPNKVTGFYATNGWLCAGFR
ncbi:hypothetical protein BDP27DRAFT_857555 [Rhodocollybia butyracea]|uniref:MYND-type domain-containing protein n=1 Tax=Rhodocollybia butyracea TaxID=206335 RepID=A0A9P5PRA6_9AGAR|nr:hypothetical protein BDP27DRAFT_857555 [Rhodocollybia butyracea]